MKIDVISDVICPWCYLGKARLAKALTLVPELKVEVRYRPYLLDASIPAQGLSRDEYMRAKFGDRDLKAMHKPIEDGAREAGITYNFDKITRTPNSIDAHRLIRWAAQAGKQDAVVTALFEAYWRDGKDVGDWAVLAEIAGACGLNKAEVAALLPTPTDVKEVLGEIQQAYQIGVQGVPTFIFAERYGVSGAQSPEALAHVLRDVAGKTEA